MQFGRIKELNSKSKNWKKTDKNLSDFRVVKALLSKENEKATDDIPKEKMHRVLHIV